MTREGENTNGYGDTHINAYHTAVGSLCKLSCIIAVLCEDNRAVCIGVTVHKCKTLFEVLDSLYAKHGSEDFLSTHSHILCYIIENCGTYIEALFIALNNCISAVENESSTLFNTLVNPVYYALLMLSSYNRAES